MSAATTPPDRESQPSTGFFLGQCSGHFHIQEAVYTLVFVFALGIAIFTYWSLQEGRGLGFDGSAAAWFGVATAFQQAALYIDLHRIEKERSTKTGHQETKQPPISEDYGGAWLHTRLERVIRAAIIIFLLFGVGKLASLVYPLIDCAGDAGSRGFLCEVFVPDGTHKDSVFIVGSLGVFASLLLWNLLAFLTRIPHWKTQWDDRLEHSRAKLVCARIVFFFCTAVLGTTYWALVLNGQFEIIGHFSTMMIVIYVVLIVVVYALRWEVLLKKWSKMLAN